MKIKTFIEQDMQYHSGLCLDDYNGEISICASQMGKDGKVYLKWIFPQTKDRQPSGKSLPWKINLGARSQAIEILETFIVALGKDETIQPQSEEQNSFSGEVPDDGIPF